MEATALSFWLRWDWSEECLGVVLRLLHLPPPGIIDIMKNGLCDAQKTPGSALTLVRAEFKFYKPLSPLRSIIKVEKLAMFQVEIYFSLLSAD